LKSASIIDFEDIAISETFCISIGVSLKIGENEIKITHGIEKRPEKFGTLHITTKSTTLENFNTPFNNAIDETVSLINTTAPIALKITL